MEARICLDIETVGNERATEWFAKTEVKAPSNYKDQAKIDKYVEDARRKLESKAALTWHTGKVFSFAVCGVHDDNATFVHGLNEEAVLNSLTELVGDRTVYAKSGKLFDYPFLVGRYLANDIQVPSFLRDKNRMLDVDDFFSWSQSNNQRLSLDAYAHGLGISSKAGDFSVVQKAYDALVTQSDEAEGLIEQLKAYNIQDVLIVRELVRRYS